VAAAESEFGELARAPPPLAPAAQRGREQDAKREDPALEAHFGERTENRTHEASRMRCRCCEHLLARIPDVGGRNVSRLARREDV
jgi:hypothetical protein